MLLEGGFSIDLLADDNLHIPFLPCQSPSSSPEAPYRGQAWPCPVKQFVLKWLYLPSTDVICMTLQLEMDMKPQTLPVAFRSLIEVDYGMRANADQKMVAQIRQVKVWLSCNTSLLVTSNTVCC